VFNISKGITESNKGILKRNIKFINITLIIKFLISFTCNLLAIFKAKYSKLILPFKISFIIAIHVVLLISNKNINIKRIKEKLK
jgi:uncharacterized membrane protein